MLENDGAGITHRGNVSCVQTDFSTTTADATEYLGNNKTKVNTYPLSANLKSVLITCSLID